MAEREGLVLAGLDLNDGTNFELEALTFTPAQKKLLWADNASADGAVPVQEAHYENCTFELQVRVAHQSTANAALAKVGELMDALQACERTAGGVALEWTPAETEPAYTAYALTAELAELPITVEGELAGWFLNAPVVKVKIICRPFLYAEEVTALEATESGAEPHQVVYVEVGGDVPAEAKLIVTDKATQDRRYFRFGRDVVESEEGNPPTLITAASLVTTNFSGEAKTRSGAYSEEKVKRATAVTQPTTMCGTGALEHVGSFRIFGHVYAASEDARYRISYRNGDGPLVYLPWKQPPVTEQFCDIDFGEATFDEAVTGEQRSEVRVEVKTAGEPIELDLNYLELIPSSRGFGRARGLAPSSATKLLAYDTFVQSEGALAGKSAPVGGTWAEAGDESGFLVLASEHVARRSAVSDADLNTGRYAVVGSEEPTTSKVSVDFSQTTAQVFGSESFRAGVLLRYVDTSNWLAAVITDAGILGGRFRVIKRVAGTVSSLGESSVNSLGAGEGRTIALQATANGSWSAWAYDATLTSEPTAALGGQDSVLATGGTLAKGKGGFYDARTSASALTRHYDNFSLMAGDEAAKVCYSGKTCRLTSEGFTRQDSEGKYEGVPSIYRGSSLYLTPAGEAGELNRLVVALRRNDADTEASPNVTDKQSATVTARERFLSPR